MKKVIRLRELIREAVLKFKYIIMTRLYGMDVSGTAKISFGARLDKVNPEGIHIGNGTYVASGAIVFSHDYSRGIHMDTKIGERCFIGANAIVMCGVTIGDEVVVGAGCVVTKDVPSGCIVAGNPAKVIREGIHTGKYGRIL